MRDKGRRVVSVLLKRDSVLSRVKFCGLYWLGSLKDALKVEEIRVASSSAHSSSSGSQRGLPLNGERSRRVADMVVAITVWSVRGCEARLRAEEKGELRESVQLLGSLSESSCGFGINSGANSDPCVVCAPPRSTSDDGDGAGRIEI